MVRLHRSSIGWPLGLAAALIVLLTAGAGRAQISCPPGYVVLDFTCVRAPQARPPDATALPPQSPPRAPRPPAAAAPSRPPVYESDSIAPSAPARPLVPVRAYLTARDLPPAGIAAYGVVAFRARPTPQTRPRLARVCEAFRANLPRQREAAGVPRSDQMLSVWPVDDADRAERLDTCDFALDHYDLFAGQSAIRDAQRQAAQLNGEGPFLLGWSPSSTRGQPDKLVMVINLSALTSDDSMNAAFRFWVEKVVEDPSLWREGFSKQKLKYAIADFLNDHGDDLEKVVTIFGLKPGDK